MSGGGSSASDTASSAYTLPATPWHRPTPFRSKPCACTKRAPRSRAGRAARARGSGRAGDTCCRRSVERRMSTAGAPWHHLFRRKRRSVRYAGNAGARVYALAELVFLGLLRSRHVPRRLVRPVPGRLLDREQPLDGVEDTVPVPGDDFRRRGEQHLQDTGYAGLRSDTWTREA